MRVLPTAPSVLCTAGPTTATATWIASGTTGWHGSEG